MISVRVGVTRRTGRMPATPTDAPALRIGARVLLLDHLGLHLWDREPASSTGAVSITDEKAGLIEHRWWAQPDLAACRDRLLPSNLPVLFAEVLNGTLGQPLGQPLFLRA